METLCKPCERDNEKHDATGFCTNCDEYLCDRCRKFHLKIKQLQCHVIIEKAEALEKGEQEGGQDGGTRLTQDNKECLEHVGNMYEYFCTGCNALACSECVLTGHKECTTVYIPNINISCFWDLTRPAVAKTLKETTDIVEKGISGIKSAMKANISEMKKRQEEMAAGLDGLKHDAIQFIEELFNGLKKLTEDITIGDEKHCNVLIRKSENALRKFKNQMKKVPIGDNEVETENESGKEMKNGTTDGENADHIKSLMKINTLLQTLPNAPSSSQRKSHTHNEEALENIQEFVDAIFRFASEKKDHLIQEQQLINMSMETENDTEQSQISAAMVTGTKLVVADRGNKKIKVFDTAHNVFITELKVPGMFQDTVKQTCFNPLFNEYLWGKK